MTSNLKIILSAVGVAALLASPAMAKTKQRHETAPALVNIPVDTHASVASSGQAVTVYAPDVKVPAHTATGLNPDFQLSSER